MVFSSFPLYLDPPANNWNQQQVQLPGGGGGGNDSPQLPRPLGPVPPRADAVGMAGLMRPAGSMAGRARLAKLEQAALRCPRCDSTNTKFCYFNNYSLSQPRHFCKACRRYWTHGGALRNVPVGGGCRRSNKRTKPPPAASCNAGLQSGGASSSAPVVPQQQQPPPHLLPDRGAPGSSFAAGMETLDQPVGLENLRFESPMIPSGLEPPPPPHPQPSLAPVPNPYSSFIIGDGGDLAGRFGGHLDGNSKAPSSGLLMQQLASVKMEDSECSRLPQYLWGGGGGSDGGGWATTGFSGFN